jgi:polyisoprenoid-binding protein YceI
MLLALLLLAPLLHAQSKTYEVTPGAPNLAVFEVQDSVDPFDGKTSKVSGTIVADPAAVTSSTVDLTVDLGSLDTGVDLRNHHMREKYLHTAQFPNATFKSVSINGPATIAASQPADISITGDFTLHGITKRMTIPVRVVLLTDGRIHAISRFAVKMPEFGINVPSNVFVTVDSAVQVRLDVFAKAK